MADDKKKPDLDHIAGYEVPDYKKINKDLAEHAKWERENRETILADGRQAINKVYTKLDDDKEGLRRHGSLDKVKLEDKLDDVYMDLGKALESYLEHAHEKAGAKKAYKVFKDHFETEKKKGNKEYYQAVLKEFEKAHGNNIRDAKESQIDELVEKVRRGGGTTGRLHNELPKLFDEYVEGYSKRVQNKKFFNKFGDLHDFHVQDAVKKEYIDKLGGTVNDELWHDSGKFGALEVVRYATAPDDRARAATSPDRVGVYYKAPKAEKK